MEKIIFAAGCFWGVQYYFDQIPGVIQTTVGYSGGHTKDPTYEQVCSHKTGHAEVVLVEFDKNLVNIKSLMKHFFRMHDPTQLNRQGPDIGDSYRSAIFYLNNQQKLVAEKVLNNLQVEFKQPIVTEITAASEFYAAEDYHQKYSQKTGIGMCHVAYRQL